MAVARILVCDDDERIRQLVHTALDDSRYTIQDAEDAREVVEALETGRFDLLIIDRVLPDQDGVFLLGELRRNGFDAPAIIITGHGDLNSARDALSFAATDYLPKPFNMEDLQRLVRGAIGESGYPVGNALIEREWRKAYGYDLVMSANRVAEQCYVAAARAAKTEVSVLIEGKTGTGKEYLARFIHYVGPRSRKPFVSINCSAVPEHLLESELFGHEKGAFTHATARRVGLFETADGGTLFLDEIGEMTMSTQVKLLRFVQERKFHRLGSNDEIPVDVRVIAATNKNLLGEVQAGRFRDDLYYRLAVVPLRLPPLCERPEDIELFAEHLVLAHSQRAGRPQVRLSPEALQCLRQYSWPGNVRELDNVMQRALLLADGETIEPQHLLLPCQDLTAASTGLAGAGLDDVLLPLAVVEQRHLQRVLAAAGGDRKRAALLLGLDARALARKLAEHGLDAGGARPPAAPRPPRTKTKPRPRARA